MMIASSVASAVHALRTDLLAESGPSISTMRNYRFAILPYPPQKEFELRRHIRQLTDELLGLGWNVLGISLHRLLMDRLRDADPRLVQSIIDTERRLHEKDPERGLNVFRERVAAFVEGPDGIAADVIRLVSNFADAHPDSVDRSLILLGRAGALYPCYRSSALLKHLDGKTRNVPVVLLYPGERKDVTALSFMGELPADRDYRPRIYS